MKGQNCIPEVILALTEIKDVGINWELRRNCVWTKVSGQKCLDKSVWTKVFSVEQ